MNLVNYPFSTTVTLDGNRRLLIVAGTEEAFNQLMFLVESRNSLFRRNVMSPRQFRYRYIPMILRRPRAIIEAVKLYKFCRFLGINIVLTELYTAKVHHVFTMLFSHRIELYGCMQGGGHVPGLKWSQVYLTRFFVHGNLVKRILNEEKIKCNELVSVGLVNNQIYKVSLRTLSASRVNQKYDLCFISNCKSKFPNHASDSVFFRQLTTFFKLRKIKICVAGRYLTGTRLGTYEKSYFMDSFSGLDVDFYPRSGFSTYELADCSVVTTGDFTTALVESFERGNKIVAYNTSYSPLLEFPYNGIWNTFSFDHFTRMFDFVSTMSKEEWDFVSQAARRDIETFQCD